MDVFIIGGVSSSRSCDSWFLGMKTKLLLRDKRQHGCLYLLVLKKRSGERLEGMGLARLTYIRQSNSKDTKISRTYGESYAMIECLSEVF